MQSFGRQVYVRARPCADGQLPPEDMFERKKDAAKNIVIKVCLGHHEARHGKPKDTVANNTHLLAFRTLSGCSMGTTLSASTTYTYPTLVNT
jgi:hypothetical protein